MDERREAETGIPPDPVIEAFKKDIDRTLLRESLKLTHDERLRDLMRLHEFYDELRRTRRAAR